MAKLVDELQQLHPETIFRIGDNFHWHPQTATVFYQALETEEDCWSLLHEVGHAQLQHQSYESDMQLLSLEVAAWVAASRIGVTVGIIIDKDHIEDCLDTYRDWIHKRSTCPACSLQGIQRDSEHYICINCNHTWIVTLERFCRPYRRSQQ